MDCMHLPINGFLLSEKVWLGLLHAFMGNLIPFSRVHRGWYMRREKNSHKNLLHCTLVNNISKYMKSFMSSRSVTM